MSPDGHLHTYQVDSVVDRLYAVRNYLRSIHSACLGVACPEPGHVILVDEGDCLRTGLTQGGYTLVAKVGRTSLLCPVQLTHRGELEHSDRLVTAPSEAITLQMLVGRESMVIPE